MRDAMQYAGAQPQALHERYSTLEHKGPERTPRLAVATCTRRPFAFPAARLTAYARIRENPLPWLLVHICSNRQSDTLGAPLDGDRARSNRLGVALFLDSCSFRFPRASLVSRRCLRAATLQPLEGRPSHGSWGRGCSPSSAIYVRWIRAHKELLWKRIRCDVVYQQSKAPPKSK